MPRMRGRLWCCTDTITGELSTHIPAQKPALLAWGNWNTGNPEQRLAMPTCTLMSKIKSSLIFFETHLFQTPPPKRQLAVKPLRVKRSRLVLQEGGKEFLNQLLWFQLKIYEVWVLSSGNDVPPVDIISKIKHSHICESSVCKHAWIGGVVALSGLWKGSTNCSEQFSYPFQWNFCNAMTINC